MKSPGAERENGELKVSEENSYKLIERAEELIRTLDAESNEQMEQISAEDKLGRRDTSLTVKFPQSTANRDT